MSNCTSTARVELDLYFRLMGEPSELGPASAAEARSRGEQVLLSRSPLAYQALQLARDTLRSIKPADTLVRLPTTAVACLALLEALDVPELTLEIRSNDPWDELRRAACIPRVGIAYGGEAPLGVACLGGVFTGVASGGVGGNGSGGDTTYGAGGQGTLVAGGGCVGACGGGGMGGQDSGDGYATGGRGGPTGS